MRDVAAPGGRPAPVDPRGDLPAFGSLPVTADLESLVTRVIAPNASALTLDGTNTYLIGEPGSGEVLVLDPGPADDGHLARVEAAVAARDAQVAAVVVTHHHLDHCEAAQGWAARFGVKVHAPSAEVAGPDGVVLRDGDVVGPSGAQMTAIATPGHCSDHTGFRVASGSILIGDHVLGRGTSVVAFPDGDLVAYMDSLARVLALGPDTLHPGHGPSLVGNAAEVVTYYAAHRAHRERQVLAVLAYAPATPREIVEVIYAAVPKHLWPAAEASTRAALVKLAAQGVVEVSSAPGGVETARLSPERSRLNPPDADQ
ncbi:MAG: glyoxylase-like metal-dependent hydrolase (beta-lactamase superfamily II) [Glaciecola sp.]|jgi:glyoxylase-like metal-dependent hydrolase (beta-lactamase superfamily II)